MFVSRARKGPNGESPAWPAQHKTYLWDTSANFGVVWGYPKHREIELTNLFYAKNTVKLDGGMQYFDTTDPGLAEYGHAVFFFTTAAASQYQSLYGDKAAAKSFIDWMLRNANSYGLMPEHIKLDAAMPVPPHRSPGAAPNSLPRCSRGAGFKVSIILSVQ